MSGFVPRPPHRTDGPSGGDLKGRTLKTVRGAGNSRQISPHVDETGWFAARAFEKPDHTVRFAHTSPGFCRGRWSGRGSTRRCTLFIDWMDREIAFYRSLPDFREPAHRNAMLDLFTAARQVYASLAER